MFGSIRSLKPGQQGGGHDHASSRKRKSSMGDAGIGPAPRPAVGLSSQRAPPVSELQKAIQQQHEKEAAEKKGKRQKQHLPEWIEAGNRIGYLSSSGRVCEGFVESISLEKCEVKFVFADDESVWKRVPFDIILSKANPLRRLAVAGERSKNMNEMLSAAQESEVDKTIMLRRIMGESAAEATPGKEAGSDAGNSGSAAPEAGSAPGSVGNCSCSRSRSRSPQIASAENSPQKVKQHLPEWIAVGRRVNYWSKSCGQRLEVDIEEIGETEVKVVFVEDRSSWKGVPISMILSERNPLMDIGDIAQKAADEVVDLDEGSDASADGSMSPIAGPPVKPKLPQQHVLPEWISAGQRVLYKSKSSGKFCQVEVDVVDFDKKTVKIVFVDNREVWKGIPFSMLLSADSPLKRG